MHARTIRSLLAVILAFSATAAFSAETLTPVVVGTGTAKLGLLLQSWAYDDTTAPTTKFNFRMRRAEIKLTGTLNENVRWFVMADPAKTLSAAGDNKILQDLGVAYALSPSLEFVLGQVKIPTTAEGYESSSELLFAERSYVARLYGDRRESGALLTWKESIFRVNAMISSGQKSNIDDTNDKKDLSVRAEVLPNDAMKFGVFTQAGDYSYGMKSRYGANFRLNFGDLLVKGEGVVARDNGIGAHGWAIDSGYAFNEHFQPAVRYETFESTGLTPHAVTVGLNYLELKNNAKVQLAYVALSDMLGTSGTYVPNAGTKGSLFTLVFQAAL